VRAITSVGVGGTKTGASVGGDYRDLLVAGVLASMPSLATSVMVRDVCWASRPYRRM